MKVYDFANTLQRWAKNSTEALTVSLSGLDSMGLDGPGFLFPLATLKVEEEAAALLIFYYYFALYSEEHRARTTTG